MIYLNNNLDKRAVHVFSVINILIIFSSILIKLVNKNQFEQLFANEIIQWVFICIIIFSFCIIVPFYISLISLRKLYFPNFILYLSSIILNITSLNMMSLYANKSNFFYIIISISTSILSLVLIENDDYYKDVRVIQGFIITIIRIFCRVSLAVFMLELIWKMLYGYTLF